MTSVDHVKAIQTALGVLKESRERAVSLINSETTTAQRRSWLACYAATDFRERLEDLCFVLCAAVHNAEAEDDGPFMRKLLPPLETVQRMIVADREILAGGGLNSPESIFQTRFLKDLDQLEKLIERLHEPARGETIESIMELTKGGCPLPQIRRQWENRIDNPTGLWLADIQEIQAGLKPDIPGSEHPIEKAWRAKNATMPAFDDSILVSECRTIECQRERHGVPALSGEM